MIRSRKLMALCGFIVGVASMYIINYFTPPVRINYAFVVDDSAISPLQLLWWLTVIAVGLVGAGLGWLTASVLNRKR